MIKGRSGLSPATFLRTDDRPVEWLTATEPVPYAQALASMEARAEAIRAGAPEQVWLLEHPSLYSAGTSADPRGLLEPDRFPVHASGRGGQYTYHGPGQRVAYVMLDLAARKPDLRLFIATLEQWIIDALAEFQIRGERREDRVGVWVRRPEKSPEREDKIAAIGIRVRRWVSFHGISLNVDPDLTHFAGIVPCGIAAHGVTSLVDLGLPVTLDDCDLAMRSAFEPLFGRTVTIKCAQ